ncbi:MAG: lysophospholipid acyltransferase family protein, partial [Geobacter sp.]
SYDNSIIYKQNALRNMLSVIRKKGVVGLLVDQAVLPEEGCLINFLGRPAWASRVPVVLARKTGVPVLPVFMYREGGRYVIDIQPMLVFSDVGDEAAVQADVQRYSAEIERFIVRHPTDWYWVHRRWKRTEGL